jgi:hypothetical protein
LTFVYSFILYSHTGALVFNASELAVALLTTINSLFGAACAILVDCEFQEHLFANWNLWLNQSLQLQQRLLPAEVTHLCGDGCGKSFMQDFDFRATTNRSQRDSFGHGSFKTGIVELVGETNSLARNQFQKSALERMTVTGLKTCERHVKASARLRVDPVNFPQIAVWRQPSAQGVGIEKSFVNTFCGGTQHAVKPDGVVCFGHDIFLLVGVD